MQREPTLHRLTWTQDRPDPVYGFRAAIDGSACGILIVAHPHRERVFGGPIVNRRLTEYDSVESAIAFPLPTLSERLAVDPDRFPDLFISPLIELPVGLAATTVTLLHHSTNGRAYTIHEFTVTQVMPPLPAD